MTDCFDQELSEEEARRCREWLLMPAGRPLWRYLNTEAERHHSGSINAITDNPIKDILVGQRELSAEQTIITLIEKMDNEVSQLNS